LSPTLHRPVYTLRIELLDIDPPIWRRVEVPGWFTLADVHDVVQLVMGWDDSHLHLFEIGDVRYGFGDNEWDDDERDDSEVVLGDVGLNRGDRFRYNYDFGDDWVHAVTVEAVRRDVPEGEVPRLLDGARACPPEDCGGVSGYHDLVEALADPDHEEHEHLRRWLGRPWDPDAYDVALHDRVLRGQRWPQPPKPAASSAAAAGRGAAGPKRSSRRSGMSSGVSSGMSSGVSSGVSSGSDTPAGGAKGRKRPRGRKAAGTAGTANTASTTAGGQSRDPAPRDLTPPHMARANEVLGLMDPLRHQVPWIPDSVVGLAAELIQRFCLEQPEEFLGVRKPELWLAAGVHAAFMLHPHGVLYPLKPLTLQELADLCDISVASISKRSGQLRQGVRVEWRARDR
jgi:hypothetical protein